MSFAAYPMYGTPGIRFLEILTQSLQKMSPKRREVSLPISNVCSLTSPKHLVTMLEETRAVQTPMRASIRPANNTSKDALLNVVAVNPQRKATSGTTTTARIIEKMTEKMGMTHHLGLEAEGIPTVDHHPFSDGMTCLTCSSLLTGNLTVLHNR